jgi:hypothetical protein
MTCGWLRFGSTARDVQIPRSTRTGLGLATAEPLSPRVSAREQATRCEFEEHLQRRIRRSREEACRPP